MNETIGEKIKRLRGEMNLTQENIHHNQAQVSLIEKGRISNPDETTLRIIAKGLDTTLDNLIEGTDWVKTEDRSLGKEIAISPNDIDIEVDDSGNVEWAFKVYPLYDDKGERNEYCPVSGDKLIYKCDKCERLITEATQTYCFGCGARLFNNHTIDPELYDLVPAEAWLDILVCGDAIFDLTQRISTRRIELAKSSFDSEALKEQNIKLMKKDKKSLTTLEKKIIDGSIDQYRRLMWFNIQVYEEVLRKLKKLAAKLFKDRGEVSIDDQFKKTNFELYNNLSRQLFEIIHRRTEELLYGDGSEKDNRILNDLVDLMKMLQSDDQHDEVISKIENMVNEEKKNKNSEDGNSETAESEIENAEKQKMEGGEE